MRKLIVFAFAIIAMAVVLSYAVTPPRDVGNDRTADISNTVVSDTQTQAVHADLDIVDIVKADRIESAVNSPSERVPATLFARQVFNTESDLYQSRKPDVETPPNENYQPETFGHRGREDV